MIRMKQICLLIMAFSSLVCDAQTDSSHAAGDESTKTKATLGLDLTYSNNANYYGQVAEESLPYVAVQASYRLGFGLYFTGMAYKLLQGDNQVVSASNLGAGVAFPLSKKVSLDFSYNHTFYPSYSPLLQASNPDNATALLTYETWVSSTLNVDYAFGKTSDYFVTAGIGKTVNLTTGEKGILSVKPSFDIVGGTQHFYQIYLIDKRLEDSLLGLLLPPPDNSPASVTSMATEFNLISYNFKAPISYNRANYVIEAAYQLSILSNKAQSGPGKVNSFISLSFYYQF
jgi:hypothetical protein